MSKRKIRRIFDINYLNEFISKDKAILIGNYGKLNRESFIDFKCNCGKEHMKNFRTIVDYGGAFCIECTEKNKSKKREETNLKIYGNKNILQVEEIKEKIKQTCIEKYSVENPSQSEIIKQRKIETCMKNHGVSNPTKSKTIRDKVKQTNLKIRGVEYSTQCPEVKEKAKQTNLKIRGVEHPKQSQEVIEKTKQTCMKIYGVTNPLNNELVMKKTKQTNLNRRGVEYPTQCPNVREKVKQANLRNRGVEYPSQCPLVQKKKETSMRTFKDYICPSGKIRRIQGYENYALDELFKTFTEEQIITDREEIPTIEYLYEDTKHVYFPDIFIPHLNKIIEVKSTWTYNLDVEKLKHKENFTKLKGYEYEYWIIEKGKPLYSLVIKTEHD